MLIVGVLFIPFARPYHGCLKYFFAMSVVSESFFLEEEEEVICLLLPYRY